MIEKKHFPIWALVVYVPYQKTLFLDDWKTLPVYCKNLDNLEAVLDGLSQHATFNYVSQLVLCEDYYDIQWQD